MPRIEASVGTGGNNLSSDVRIIQKLLNRHDLAPLAPLRESGLADSPTITAIRHFQVRYVGMRSPDGRVDPDGRTLKRLNAGGGSTPLPRVGENSETRRLDRDARASHVDGRVKETAVTTRIIDTLVPYFHNVRARIISGYLSDTDLFWKVNYHWEYLLGMLTHSLTLPVEPDCKQRLSAMRGALLSYPPDPPSGYTSGAVGQPVDRSSVATMIKRHQILSQQKRAFAAEIDRSKLKEKSRKSPKAFDLAAAPVARPGTSKHGTGYALDIEGDNTTIKSICKSHGASLVFDEKSHVHVEFRNGVS